MNLEENIARMELELADMKKQLEQQDKLELKGGEGYCLQTLYTSHNTSTFANDGSAVTRGAFRATKTLAEIADKNMVTRNRLEAYVHQIQGNGEGDCTVCKEDGKYRAVWYRGTLLLGAVYMNRETAKILCEKLNAGEIKL